MPHTNPPPTHSSVLKNGTQQSFKPLVVWGTKLLGMDDCKSTREKIQDSWIKRPTNSDLEKQKLTLFNEIFKDKLRSNADYLRDSYTKPCNCLRVGCSNGAPGCTRIEHSNSCPKRNRDALEKAKAEYSKLDAEYKVKKVQKLNKILAKLKKWRTTKFGH